MGGKTSQTSTTQQTTNQLANEGTVEQQLASGGDLTYSTTLSPEAIELYKSMGDYVAGAFDQTIDALTGIVSQSIAAVEKSGDKALTAVQTRFTEAEKPIELKTTQSILNPILLASTGLVSVYLLTRGKK